MCKIFGTKPTFQQLPHPPLTMLLILTLPRRALPEIFHSIVIGVWGIFFMKRVVSLYFAHDCLNFFIFLKEVM